MIILWTQILLYSLVLIFCVWWRRENPVRWSDGFQLGNSSTELHGMFPYFKKRMKFKQEENFQLWNMKIKLMQLTYASLVPSVGLKHFPLSTSEYSVSSQMSQWILELGLPHKNKCSFFWMMLCLLISLPQ